VLRPSHTLKPLSGWRVPPGPGPTERGQASVTRIDAPWLPSVLLLHDSFGPYLQPFLAQRCRELRCLWQGWVPEAVVDRQRPDVVVMIKAERNLIYAPADDQRSLDRLTGAEFEAGLPVWSLADGPPPRVEG
jgi:hypothetical protein